ncbi:hypothetical protein HanRHA438_Chr11g0502681 [Helianthus annuus]|nr:hypothetical protein HanRHA438_Chr11g0502681 [Helianthus annuus]
MKMRGFPEESERRRLNRRSDRGGGRSTEKTKLEEESVNLRLKALEVMCSFVFDTNRSIGTPSDPSIICNLRLSHITRILFYFRFPSPFTNIN